MMAVSLAVGGDMNQMGVSIMGGLGAFQAVGE